MLAVDVGCLRRYLLFVRWYFDFVVCCIGLYSAFGFCFMGGGVGLGIETWVGL